MTTFVILPDGTRRRVAIAITLADKTQGLKDIPVLPLLRVYGMLFVWTDEQPRVMTMEGCLIPLDIVWMDSSRKVVDLRANAKPNVGLAYAADVGINAMYVLELGAGECAAHSVDVGSVLKF